MKTLLLTTLFFFFSIGLTFGQTKKSTSSSNSQAKSAELRSTNVSPETKSDGYFGYKDQILKRLIDKEIPQSFPTPSVGQTREDYKHSMLGWFKKNLNMVEEKYHSNLK
jgi:hypothetical protein